MCLLGNTLVTIQTGPEGKRINQVLLEEGCNIARELYLGIVLDRSAAKPVVMASSEGGVEIEKVAEETPELIFKEHFTPDRGLEDYQVRKLCSKLKLTGASVASATRFMKGLCRVYSDLDCSMAEINPLVVTAGGELIARLTQKSPLTTTRYSAIHSSRICGTDRKRIPMSCVPATLGSVTSS